MSIGLLLLCVIIYSLCLISGLLPVFSCVLMDNSLIINTIHFSGMKAFSGWKCGDAAHFWGCGCNVCFDTLGNYMLT